MAPGFFRKLWDKIKSAGKWIKDKVIKPVVGFVGRAGTAIGTAIGAVKGNPKAGAQIGGVAQGIAQQLEPLLKR